jgi:hypothetical protein
MVDFHRTWKNISMNPTPNHSFIQNIDKKPIGPQPATGNCQPGNPQPGNPQPATRNPHLATVNPAIRQLATVNLILQGFNYPPIDH